MTKDNASGAGMETVAWRYIDARGHFRYRGYVANFDQEYRLLKPIELVRRTDATRLLAESQAHNANLEAQVERMREALSDVLAIAILQPELHYLDNGIGTQTLDGIALLKARAALKP